MALVGFVHPIGVVLKMHAGIPDKNFRRGVRDHPPHRQIRQRPLAQDRFIAPQFGSECAVEAKHRAGGQAALPERVAVFEAIAVKVPSSARVARTTLVIAPRTRRSAASKGALKRRSPCRCGKRLRSFPSSSES